MKLQCKESNVSWFTSGKIYVVETDDYGFDVISDDEGDLWIITGEQEGKFVIIGSDDAVMVEVEE
ncbi:hypothetical protein CSP48_004017 [Salmonella enterica subsp. arizonae]|nr:hypothetical protein [Salmonella enterica subsp. arizonae]